MAIALVNTVNLLWDLVEKLSLEAERLNFFIGLSGIARMRMLFELFVPVLYIFV
jgi:hypothetical protein